VQEEQEEHASGVTKQPFVICRSELQFVVPEAAPNVAIGHRRSWIGCSLRWSFQMDDCVQVPMLVIFWEDWRDRPVFHVDPTRQSRASLAIADGAQACAAKGPVSPSSLRASRPHSFNEPPPDHFTGEPGELRQYLRQKPWPASTSVRPWKLYRTITDGEELLPRLMCRSISV
jgi:hypothetical protein